MPDTTFASSHEKTLRALCALSDLNGTLDVQGVLSRLKQAPDPEAAVQAVLTEVTLSSDVLRRKWRTAIMAVWATQHPHVPLLPTLTLSSEDVAATPMLVDALAFLDAIACQPA